MPVGPGGRGTVSTRHWSRRLATRVRVDLAVAVLATFCLAVVAVAASRTDAPARPLTRLDANPEPVVATDVQWAMAAAPGDHRIVIGLVRGTRPGPRPLLVLVPGSDGLSTTYVDVAHDLAAEGLDVAFGCWFDSGERTGTDDAMIACPEGPEITGVQVNSVGALDALVAGAQQLAGIAGPSTALFGFSRGGGLVALRAVLGGPEPWIALGALSAPITVLGTLPGETDVADLVTGPTAPALLLHGEDDGAVDPAQSRRLAAALRRAGTSVEEHYYEGLGHGIMMLPWARVDIERRIVDFVHRHLDAKGPGPVGTAWEPAPPATTLP